MNRLLDAAKIRPGTRVRVIYQEKEKRWVQKVKMATVIEVYRHHVLLDFGTYKESRKISDIVLETGDTRL